MDKNFDISKFGIEQYTLSNILHEGNIVGIKYNDVIHNVELEGNALKLIAREHGNVVRISKRLNYNTTLKDLTNEYKPPIIKGYYDSKYKNIDTYAIEFNVSGKNVVLEFDKKTVTVYTPHNGLVLVYKTDDNDILIPNALVESYHLLDDGFVYTDYKEHTSTLYFNGFKDTIRFCFEIRNKNGSAILDYLPHKIYYRNNEFSFKYDEEGMTKNCYLEGAALEYCYYKSNTNKITSIHPHVFDPFAVLYNSDPLSFWCIDTLEYLDHDDLKEFTRTVFKMYNAYDFLNIINT